MRCSDVLFRGRFVFAQTHVFRSSSLGFVSVTLMFERRVCLRHERFVPIRKMFCSITVSVSSVLRCVISDVLHSSALGDWFPQCAFFVFEYSLDAEKYIYILENSDCTCRKLDHGFR